MKNFIISFFFTFSFYQVCIAEITLLKLSQSESVINKINGKTTIYDQSETDYFARTENGRKAKSIASLYLKRLKVEIERVPSSKSARFLVGLCKKIKTFDASLYPEVERVFKDFLFRNQMSQVKTKNNNKYINSLDVVLEYSAQLSPVDAFELLIKLDPTLSSDNVKELLYQMYLIAKPERFISYLNRNFKMIKISKEIIEWYCAGLRLIGQTDKCLSSINSLLEKKNDLDLFHAKLLALMASAQIATAEELLKKVVGLPVLKCKQIDAFKDYWSLNYTAIILRLKNEPAMSNECLEAFKIKGNNVWANFFYNIEMAKNMRLIDLKKSVNYLDEANRLLPEINPFTFDNNIIFEIAVKFEYLKNYAFTGELEKYNALKVYISKIIKGINVAEYKDLLEKIQNCVIEKKQCKIEEAKYFEDLDLFNTIKNLK